MACNNCNNDVCTCNNNNEATLMFSSDIQDVYEIARLGLRVIVNKFRVGEKDYFPSSVLEGFTGSYLINVVSKEYFSAQKNKLYPAGTYLYRLCPAIPTNNTDDWSFVIYSRELTLGYREFKQSSNAFSQLIEALKTKSWCKDNSQKSLADFVMAEKTA